MAEPVVRVELTASFLDRLAAIESFLTEADAASAYDRARRAEADRKGPAVDVDPNFEALRPVLSGELPLYIRAADKLQIDSALDWAKKRGLARLVLVTSADAVYVASRLASEKVPVILEEVLALYDKAVKRR